ncbi:MAG: Clp protease N-terminal domain-containing protein, partial [Thermodesulfobacteriota bacterium]
MKLDKLTVKSQELLQSAHDMAQKFGNQAIEPIHFLKAMLDDDQGIVLSILKKIGVQVRELESDTLAALEKLVKVSGAGDIYLSREGKKILDLSFSESVKM